MHGAWPSELSPEKQQFKQRHAGPGDTALLWGSISMPLQSNSSWYATKLEKNRYICIGYREHAIAKRGRKQILARLFLLAPRSRKRGPKSCSDANLRNERGNAHSPSHSKRTSAL
eukprot:6195605-Pleurochrysis_carterae.AAC.2